MKFSKFNMPSLSVIFHRITIGMISLSLGAIGLFGQPQTAWAQTPISLPTPIVVASLFHFSGAQPKNLGVKDSQLTPCPTSPNCVCSQNTDAEHQIEPLTYSGDAQDAFDRLKSIVRALDRVAIVEDQSDYLYAEFTSKLMGFVDDVEFYLDQNAGVIQVRSASRLGESDLGVNRQRIETIRSKFTA